MKINLTTTLTYYINLETNRAGNGTTKSILKKLGFKDFRRAPGFPASSATEGCNLAHHNVLKSLIEYNKPFIVLEDDIEVNKFIKTISVPDDADAVYIGLSCMGSYEGMDGEQIAAAKISRNVSRIYNMLATHAIVYINPEYVRHTARVVEFCIDNNIPLDVGIGENMKYWKVYAINNPLFYQRGKYEKYTNRSLSTMNVVGPESAFAVSEK